MVNHARAWAGLLHAQILFAVLLDRKQLTFRSDAHPAFSQLASRCMSFDMAVRPSFSECISLLQDIRKSLLD